MKGKVQGATPPTDDPGRDVGTEAPPPPPEVSSFVRLPEASRPPDPKRGRRLQMLLGIGAVGLVAVSAAVALVELTEGSGDASPPPATATEPPPEGAPPPSAPGPGEPNTPVFQSAIDAELEALVEGRIAYGVPSEMKTGIDSDVVLRISRGPVAGLGEAAPGPVVIERVRIAPVMAAELRGRTFDIDPTGRQEQIVPPTGFSEWKWSVMPRSSGEQTLRFVVYVVVRLADGSEESYQMVKDKSVAVSVNPLYSVSSFLSAHLASVLGVLTALFGSGMALTFLKRRKEGRTGARRISRPRRRRGRTGRG
jgi:hypothetical protein